MRALTLILLLLASACLLCPSCNQSQPAAAATLDTGSGAQVELAALNTSPATLPADKPVDVKLAFAKASHQGQPGKLSKLDFSFTAACADKSVDSEALSISADQPQAKSQLDLAQYAVEVRPVLGDLVNLDRGSYGAYGGYRIAVRNRSGESLCSLEVNKMGELKLLGTGSAKYEPQLMLSLPKEGTYRYNIYAKGGCSEGKPVLAVEYTGAGFADQDTRDSSGNSYVYRFPNSTLKLYSPEAMASLKDADVAALSAYSGGGGSCAPSG